MLFIELDFWVFFAVVCTLYLILPHRGQNWMLLFASYFFYAAWDWRFLSLIGLSTIIDYFVALRLSAETDERKRKHWLCISLIFNLGMLAIFKYFNFFAAGFADLLALVGLNASPLTLSIILPVGISFYTFQTLSYTIDVYRRDMKPTKSFRDFALFVAFFPQLVAGPIERASHLLPNITKPRQLSWHGLHRGAMLCLIGLLKKIVIADGIAPAVDAVYANPAPTGIDIALATWLFAIQIYCDFSGYTDIARGVAKILGFDLMRNFAQPYFATNPQEFWRRWHISLSTWLRDYLYVSLGGNRHGARKTYRNLMATMILGGLWHGAAWNFVLWGSYQGALLALHRAFSGRRHGHGEGVVRSLGGWAMRILGMAMFFQIVCYGWLLFRSRSFEQIAYFTGRLMNLSSPDYWSVTMPNPPLAAFLGVGLLLLWDGMTEYSGNVRFYERWPFWLRAGTYAAMVYLLAFGATTATSAFIYFQF